MFEEEPWCLALELKMGDFFSFSERFYKINFYHVRLQLITFYIISQKLSTIFY